MLVRPVSSHRRVVPDDADAIGDRKVGQTSAGIEQIASNASDTIGDCNVGQAGAVTEANRLQC